jgi:nicotinamide mononucleotide adenylyltransferase
MGMIGKGQKYGTGVLSGKFLPPHLGHAALIRAAAARCRRLFVVLTDRAEQTAVLCRRDGIAPIPAAVRLSWLRAHFKKQKNIAFLYMDESDIPPYPHGTREWCEKLKRTVREGGGADKIDARFFGEEAYFQMEEFFMDTDSVLIKRGAATPAISAAEIRRNLLKSKALLLPETWKELNAEN